ncbi:hypothetical protein [Streptomyces sp. G-G2]|uniref:hypothetical protein n=1 Tax=Streptomyces sp. G-G2 TaxID=3046201 RepID=UPI0024B9C1F2|nr:hypothetical protein [Streptomyces sp. G-G2]MDJ0384555.1 hypothetical protein [Streptomyces sp. G-G2]
MAEVFELPDEVAGLALRIEMSLVRVQAEVLIMVLRVVDQVPDDDEDGSCDRDQGLGVA